LLVLGLKRVNALLLSNEPFANASATRSLFIDFTARMSLEAASSGRSR
jgi:hypothetical protein